MNVAYFYKLREFSLQMNATDLGEMTTSRGKKNYQDLGRLVKVNGETGNMF